MAFFILAEEDLTRKRFQPSTRGTDGRSIDTITPATAATATITCIPGVDHVDGQSGGGPPEILTFDDGTNPLFLAEFDEDSLFEPGVTALIDITGGPSPDSDEMRDRTIFVINNKSSPTFRMSASIGGSGLVTVTHSDPGLAGNSASILETVADVNFAVSAFSGGLDSEAVTPFTGSMQPAPDKVLETLEEGERQRGVQVIYTTFDLKTGNQFSKRRADQVTRVSDGSVWEVRQVSPWPKLLIHRMVTLVKLQEVA